MNIFIYMKLECENILIARQTKKLHTKDPQKIRFGYWLTKIPQLNIKLQNEGTN